MQEIGSRTSALLFLGDLVAFASALLITLLIRYQALPDNEILSLHLAPFSFLFLVWTTVFLITGLYDQYVSFDRKAIPLLVIKTQFINMLLAVGIFFALPLGITPKTTLAIYLVVSTSLIVLWRLYIYPKVATRNSLQALVVGTGPEAEGVTKVLKRNSNFRQVEVHSIDTSTYTDAKAIAEAMQAYIREHNTDIIIADMDDDVAKQLTPVFYNLTFLEQSVQFFSLPEFYEQLHHRIPPSLVKQSWVLQNISTQAPHYAYNFLKRLIDLSVALVLLLPCIVIFPVVIAAMKWTSRGPIFYRSERVGRFNEPIHILKFRTMTGMDSGAAALKSELEITSLGAFMRITRLDELPQLFNILRGDLSFIGPRPEMPALADVYAKEIPYYNMRHLIKPGLSGWAQINNFDVPRKGVDIERTIEKLSFDLYYLRHRSVFLDIEITLKTINAVLSRTGT